MTLQHVASYVFVNLVDLVIAHTLRSKQGRCGQEACIGAHAAIYDDGADGKRTSDHAASSFGMPMDRTAPPVQQ